MNVNISQKLPEMFSLAHDRSEESRLRLANMLADVFLQDPGLNEREQLLVNEIIDELVGHTAPHVRRMLAQRLSTSAHVPHRVLVTLACDADASVAVPILKKAYLKDEELIFVVEAYGHGHALAIAEREKISEAVVDALVATGDVDVMSTVADNLGAKISKHAMHVLLEAARFGKKLQAGLVARPELTSDMGAQLHWWLEKELRRAVVKRFGLSSGQVEESLQNSINDLLTSAEANRNDLHSMEKISEWLENRDAISSKIMIHALRMGFFKLFEVILSRHTGLDVPLVEMGISEDGGRPLSVLCRAANVDKASFVSIFLLSRGARPGEQIVNPRELSHAITAFDRLNVEKAMQIIESWKKKPDYLLKHIQEMTESHS
jgi:uncharacterized protein (DUF2336 family)